jgi:hypothetical protein
MPPVVRSQESVCKLPGTVRRIQQASCYNAEQVRTSESGPAAVRTADLRIRAEVHLRYELKADKVYQPVN